MDLPINSMVDLSIVMLVMLGLSTMNGFQTSYVSYVSYVSLTHILCKLQVSKSDLHPKTAAGRDVELLCGDTGECMAMTGLATLHFTAENLFSLLRKA